MKTRYYIITEFNVTKPHKLPKGKPPGQGWEIPQHYPFDKEWLRARLDMVWDIFVPGMREQTVPPDGWVFLVHPDSHQWMLDELHEAGVTTVPADGHNTSNFAKMMQGTDTEKLITTRIGSDDRFAPDTCERVRRWGEQAQDGDILLMPSGYSVSTKGQVYEWTWHRSGPVTLVSTDLTKTPYSLGGHSWVRERYPERVTDLEGYTYQRTFSAYSCRPAVDGDVRLKPGKAGYSKKPISKIPKWVCIPRESVRRGAEQQPNG